MQLKILMQYIPKGKIHERERHEIDNNGPFSYQGRSEQIQGRHTGLPPSSSQTARKQRSPWVYQEVQSSSQRHWGIQRHTETRETKRVR